MVFKDGTKLQSVRWRNPQLILTVGESRVESLTVSIEQGGPWVMVKFTDGEESMRPLAGRVLVVVADA